MRTRTPSSFAGLSSDYTLPSLLFSVTSLISVSPPIALIDTNTISTSFSLELNNPYVEIGTENINIISSYVNNTISYRLIYPLMDSYLNTLAKYLKQEINKIGEELYGFTENNPMIKSYYLYDGYNINLQDFPVLKVYRELDNFAPETMKCESNIMITYSIVLPQQERLSGQCYIVGRIIHSVCNNLLTKKGIEVLPNVRRRIEYRIMQMELGQPVIAITRYPLLIRESGLPKELLKYSY